jgi:hypothetical protein
VPVTRDDRDHSYWDDRGRRYTGMCELMERYGIRGPNDYYTEEARERGTYVHQYIASYFHTATTGPMLYRQVPSTYRGYLVAANEFCARTSLVRASSIAPETIVYHEPSRIAGTIDLCAWVGSPIGEGSSCPSELVVADWKTGPIARWHRIQVAGYATLKTLILRQPVKGIIVELKDDGTCRVTRVTAEDVAVFKALMTLESWWISQERALPQETNNVPTGYDPHNPDMGIGY